MSSSVLGVLFRPLRHLVLHERRRPTMPSPLFLATRRYTNAATVYENDAYGEGFKETLIAACLSLGVNVVPFPFSISDNSTIETQIKRLADSQRRIIVVVAVDNRGVSAIVNAALARGIQGLSQPGGFADFGGGQAWTWQLVTPFMAPFRSNHWRSCHESTLGVLVKERWQTLQASSFNSMLPANFQLTDSLFSSSFDAYIAHTCRILDLTSMTRWPQSAARLQGCAFGCATCDVWHAVGKQLPRARSSSRACQASCASMSMATVTSGRPTSSSTTFLRRRRRVLGETRRATMARGRLRGMAGGSWQRVASFSRVV